MSTDFKRTCLEAIQNFDRSLRGMVPPASKTHQAYDLVEKFKAECEDPGLQGVAFTLALRYFFDFFSRELMPGGIVLSTQASQDWDVLRSLANSEETLKTINSVI